MNNKLVSIHQPSYFLWLGLLDKIIKSDMYIYMDEVQLTDRAYQNRNLFLSINGVEKMLTINISKQGYREKKISQLQITNPNWYNEHYNFIKENYKKHPFYEEINPFISEFFEQNKNTISLSTVIYNSMILVFNLLDIKTEVMKMSEIKYDVLKTNSDLIKELVQCVGSTKYLSGTGGKNYMDLEDFKNSGIDVVFQEFSHPVYPQKNSETFVAGLSVLDVLFNCGIDKTRQLLNS